MENIERVSKVGTDGPLVEVGPRDNLRDFRLSIPSMFRRRIEQPELERVLELELSFKGDKLAVTFLSIQDSQEGITSRDLLNIGLPRLIRLAALTAIPESKFWESEIKSKSNISVALRENRLLLSKLYWFEHITWGSPRVVIQDLLKCKKTTANYFIRLASEEYDLPASRMRESGSATAHLLES